MFPITQFKERELKGRVLKQILFLSTAAITKTLHLIFIALVSLNGIHCLFFQLSKVWTSEFKKKKLFVFMRVLQLKNLTLLVFQQKYYLYYGSTSIPD